MLGEDRQRRAPGRALVIDLLTEEASPCWRRQQHSVIRESLGQHGIWQGELIETRKNGEVCPQWAQMPVVHDRLGNVTDVVAFFSDLSVRRQVEERLRYLSKRA
ncbi:hypothetical protein [Stutzerimonas stutzeri]|uniref:hypothetical protein n=1 Tax=Stutzerimonas stutzeri TaxID=316 RepID=UPI00210F06C1|nr:hypothetical protein [Stutzerimonas stutzeri]MCQ4321074.1 hypothetical protein [Stutzerimonas stutzeri]